MPPAGCGPRRTTSPDLGPGRRPAPAAPSAPPRAAPGRPARDPLSLAATARQRRLDRHMREPVPLRCQFGRDGPEALALGPERLHPAQGILLVGDWLQPRGAAHAD